MRCLMHDGLRRKLSEVKGGSGHLERWRWWGPGVSHGEFCLCWGRTPKRLSLSNTHCILRHLLPYFIDF